MGAEKKTFRITTAEGISLDLTFLSTGIVRCETWWGQEKDSADFDMFQAESMGEIRTEYQERAEEILLRTEALTVHVNKKTGAVAYENGQGRVFLREQEKKPGRLELQNVSEGFSGQEQQTEVSGLGQQQAALEGYQGKRIPLLHQNTSITVPFVVTNKGYALLWNCCGTGTADFTEEHTIGFQADWKKSVDYLVFTGTPLEAVQQLWKLTGPGRMLPEWAFGFWQSKMRYMSQEELLQVARTYRKKGYPLDILVVDFYHWTQMGDFAFDRKQWPCPESMFEELRKLHIKCMVSVWPHISTKSIHYEEFRKKGYFVKDQKGEAVVFPMFNQDDNGLYDPFSKEARELFFQKAKGYYEAGARIWWLDGCEPEVALEDEKGNAYSTCAGPLQERVLAYPLLHARTFYEGQRQLDPENRVLSFARSAFAGAQKYGVCVWSGDVGHDFPALRSQIAAGLSAAVSGLPFWTTDIGGFTGGDPKEEGYRELYIRWFQYGAFCPLFRVHGSRGAKCEADLLYGISRGENELWSFGEKAERILVKYDRLRYLLLPYIYTQARKTVLEGIPLMQPLYLRHQEEKGIWEIKDQYYFGEALMVCPVTEAGAVTRRVYLPGGCDWYEFWSGDCLEGGQWIFAEAELEKIPVFVRARSVVCMTEPRQYVGEKPEALIYAAVYGEQAEGSFYRDDGETYEYEQGNYEETALRYQDGEFFADSLHEGMWETKFCMLKGKEILDFLERNLS